MDPEEFPVLQYTMQLYYHTLKMGIGDDPPIQIASGILIKGLSKFYLLTCKHVFDNIRPDDVIILTSGGFSIRLPNEVKFIDGGNDSIDLALIQIKNERLKELKSRYSFLPYSNLGFNHIFDEELFYMLFGFVNKKTSLKNHAFYVGSFGYLTGIRRYRKIEKLGFNYDNNVTSEYSRKQGDFSDDDSGFPKNDAVYLHKDLLLPLIPLAISSAESLPDHAPKELSKRFSLGFTSDFKL